MLRLTSVLTCCLAAAGCSGDDLPVGVPLLGAGTHDLAMVQVDVIASAAQGLATPTDVAVNLRDPSQLWVTNYANDSVTILSGADYSDARSPTSGGAQHFLAEPMALAFSDFGNFATIHDTDDPTQGTATPADFIGPTLWDDSSSFDGGHGGHLDMLHNSPLGGGIAWERDNRYWVFDGAHSSITMYDFNDDHGYGGSNHAGAITARYVRGLVSRTEGIPSHLDMDAVAGLLYIADTNNARIAVLDTTTGTRGGAVTPNYDGADQYEVNGASLTTLVDGFDIPVVLTEKGEPTIEATTLVSPAGLVFDGDLIFVSDHATSRILAFDLEGQLVDWLALDVPPNQLGGIDIGPDGNLLVVDTVGNRLLRVSAAPAPEE